MMSLSFLKFTADLEQCRSWILESWSVILKFSLIAIFYLKLKREKISNIALAIANVGFFLQKGADISKFKEVLVLKDIFCKTTMCVLMHQISSFERIPNKF